MICKKTAVTQNFLYVKWINSRGIRNVILKRAEGAVRVLKSSRNKVRKQATVLLNEKNLPLNQLCFTK